MGTLRLLLALSVVTAHVGANLCGIRFFGTGVMAVESFYILSGFYMALVLREKYHEQTRRFYVARFVRLFPIYWAVLAFCLLLGGVYFAATGRPMGVYYGLATVSPAWWIYPLAAIANFFMVGADGVLIYESITGIHAGYLLAIPLIWTLSVELAFYALAPFVLRRRWPIIAGTFLALFAIRAFIWWRTGSTWTFWNYYFVPSALHLFFLGALSYLLYARIRSAPVFTRYRRTLGGLAFLLVAASIVFYADLGIFGLQDYRYYGLFAAALPFVFGFSKDSKWDRNVGDYSYPLYLCHGAVISFWAPLRHFVSSAQVQLYVVLALALLLSWIALRIDSVVAPVFHRFLDRFCVRQKSPEPST